MTPDNFAYWLQGSFELHPDQTEFDTHQIVQIKMHAALALVSDPDNYFVNSILRVIEGDVEFSIIRNMVGDYFKKVTSSEEALRDFIGKRDFSLPFMDVPVTVTC